MSALTLCLIIFGAMLVLMAIRVPIAVAMFANMATAMGTRMAMRTNMAPKMIKHSVRALMLRLHHSLQISHP